MLYHWHELDLGAATARNSKQDGGRHCAARIVFDHKGARALARGLPFRINGAAAGMRADNDAQADPVARRLRKAGLGVIGNPDHRARPGDYRLARQLRRTFDEMTARLSHVIAGLNEKIRECNRQKVVARSHTMVSNDADGDSIRLDGAQRQRS